MNLNVMVQHAVSYLPNLSEDEQKLIPSLQFDIDDYGNLVEELWIIVQKLVWTLQDWGERKKRQSVISVTITIS